MRRLTSEIAPHGRISSLQLLRWVVVACQGGTILVTWPLWHDRTDPPLLPLLPIPAIDIGFVLLATLLLSLVRPKIGVFLHLSVLFVAFSMDQTRIQPQVVSQAILLLASLGTRPVLLIGRTHLITLWCWAGMNKLFSPTFNTEVGPWIFDGIPGLAVVQPIRPYFGWIVITLEVGTGLLSIHPSTRRIAVTGALVIHLGTLTTLSPLGHDTNQSIWAWNVALPFAALILLLPWRASLAAEMRSSSWVARVAVVFLFVYPVGYHFGAVDAYLAHHLYTGNVPSALVCDRDAQCSQSIVYAPLETLRVPLPPEHRVFRSYFERTCDPGDSLHILDGRWWYRHRPFQIWDCPVQ